MAQGMNKLNEALVSLPEVRELLLSLDAGTSPIAVSGLSGVHRAQLTAAVRHKTQRPLLIVCADENEANRMAGDLHELLGEDVSLLFAREWQLRFRLPRLGAAAHRLAVQPCRRKSADPGRDGRRPDAANAPARRAARRGDGHFARRPL